MHVTKTSLLHYSIPDNCRWRSQCKFFWPVEILTDLTRKIGNLLCKLVIYCVNFSVNFILQKFCLCKKNDKYEVWEELAKYGIKNCSTLVTKRCTGEELSLLHCPHTSLRPCGVNKVAGVTCIKSTGDCDANYSSDFDAANNQERHRLQLQQELHQVLQVNVNPIFAEPSPQPISGPNRPTTAATTTEITTAPGATAALENINTQVIIK